MKTKTNPLKELQKYGQSFWMDNINRDLIASGELLRLIEEDGLRGVTSNPTIFAKAIKGSGDYDKQISAAVRDGKDVPNTIETLATTDIQNACDVLRPIYNVTAGRDGFVSLEVNPHLAHDTQNTLLEARRLWGRVNRPNLMIKVPATREGIPAIEQLTAEGLNINVTLMFSLRVYEQVAAAYKRGLERRLESGVPLNRVASVASLFVSRVDTKVDKLLEEKIKSGRTEAERNQFRSLLGRVAIANAKVMYQRYQELFPSNSDWRKFAEKGAQPQRLLWGSTSTKNPAYRDTYYVEALIGPDTVDTVPSETIQAFRHHGQARPTLETDLEQARQILEKLASTGIDLDQVTDELQQEGVESFAKSFDELAEALTKKQEEFHAIH